LLAFGAGGLTGCAVPESASTEDLDAAVSDPARTVEGRLSIVITERHEAEDPSQDEQEEIHLISDPDEDLYRLDIPKSVLHGKRLSSGLRVRVTVAHPDELSESSHVLHVEDLEILDSGPKSLAPGSTFSRSKENVRTAAIVLLNYSDAKVPQDMNRIALEPRLREVNEMYEIATHGLIRFNFDRDEDGKPDIFGPYDIAHTTLTSCQPGMLATKAKQYLNGLQHQHVLFVTPPHGCSDAGTIGMAEVKSSFQEPVYSAFSSGGPHPRASTLAHELGHNLWLGHAGTDFNDNGTFETGEFAYGDLSSFMGWYSLPSTLNAPLMVQLGVFDRFAGKVVEGESGKKYRIANLHRHPNDESDPQVVVFRKPGIEGVYYFLSFKPGPMPGQPFPTNHAYHHGGGVTIHTHTWEYATSRFVKTLSNTDRIYAASDVTIEQVAGSLRYEPDGVTPKSVEVIVRMPQRSACTPRAPSLTPFRSTYSQLEANAVTRFSIAVANNDSPGCPPTLFNIVPELKGAYSNLRAKTSDWVKPGDRDKIWVEIQNDGVTRDITFAVEDADVILPAHPRVSTTVRFEVTGSGNDTCPNDPNKTQPGVCGCGVADTDSDRDGVADCQDGCPADRGKTAPGVCGCGASDVDSDGDGAADCEDGCPADRNKVSPGACGCGATEDSCGDNDVRPGVRMAHYSLNASIGSMPDFDALSPDAEAVLPAISIADYRGQDRFAVVFRGALRIEAAGTYSFQTRSDDGSLLHINGKLVVSNDGVHGPRNAQGDVSLGAGLHPFELQFFENSGGETLDLSYRRGTEAFKPLPPSMLFHSVGGPGGGEQTHCASTNEGGTAELVCAPGQNITRIAFASYGTPGGGCGAYETGTCHAASSLDVLQRACVGKGGCKVPANNGTFSDPCRGVPKRLYVEFVCSAGD
jgi:hypothetical protein